MRYIIVVFILVVAGFVIAEDNLTCCQPSTFILYDDESNYTCYDPKKDSVSPVRLGCDGDAFIRLSNFSVSSGMIEFQVSPLYKISFSSDEACYGNFTKNRNLARSKPVTLLCIKEEEIYIARDRILDYCDLVTIVFLGLTAIIYAVISELRDLFGKSVINFCGSLAIGWGILSIMKLTTYEDMTACAIRGFLVYYFMVASFFWSNAIAIQVLRDTRRPNTEDYGWKEFRWYALYSWGVPTILTTILVIVNYHPGDHQRPGIGLNHCWFISKEQQWYYLNSVITILLVINFLIFVYIAMMIWRFSIKSTHMKTLKFKLSMTIRLIVVMGLPWIFEMISSIIGNNGSVIVIMLDAVTTMQGVLVFLVLVVRKRVVRVLHQRGLLGWCSGPVERWLASGEDVVVVEQPDDVFLAEDYQRDHTYG